MSRIAPLEAAAVEGPSRSWLPLLVVAVVAVVAGGIFLSNPQIDLAAGRVFYQGEGIFFGRTHRWVEWVRNVFIVFYWACIVAALVGLYLTRHTRETPAWAARLGAFAPVRLLGALIGIVLRPIGMLLDALDKGRTDRVSWLGWRSPQWFFMLLCLAIGPGLVANLILKDQWGRARPGHVTEFGGKKNFTPPLIPVKECPRNCSFVSGEASSMYMPFFAAAAIVPQGAPLLVVGGVVGGLAAGAVRMAQGGHFLSDVIFAGVFMALTVLVLRRLVFGPPGPRGGDGHGDRRA